MKRIFWIASILSLVCVCAFGQDNSSDQNGDDVYYQDDNNNAPPPPDDASQQADGSAPTYEQFYDQLNPYGQWINYPGYGYVWVPNQLPPDFSPYMTGGHWVYTDMGWAWVSDYDWGWACFHYGRWFMDDSYGWMWMPGYDWAPAWVVWGDYGDYYCWAPIGPGVIVSPHYRPDPHYWHFIHHDHILDPHIDHFVARNDDIVRNEHITYNDFNTRINVNSHANTYKQSVFFTGPKSAEVEKYTGHPVTRVTINTTTHAGATTVESNKLNIYRPNIQRTAKQPAPANVKNPQDIHPANGNGNNVTPAPPRRENNAPAHTETPQKTPTWSPPRENQPRPAPVQQPVQRTQQQPVQRAPERSFIPTERPAQNYSPPQRSFTPAPSRGGGGGRR